MDVKELQTELATLRSELKSYFEKAAEEQRTRGTMLEETKRQIDKLQKQVDAIDLKLVDREVAKPTHKSFEETCKENEGLQQLLRDRKGTAVIRLEGKQVSDIMERKTTMTEGAFGFATTGVLQIDRIPGVTIEARQMLTVRDLLFARPTQMSVVDFVKVSTAPSKASPIAEASEKFQNQTVFSSASERIRTIATWIPGTKQLLDDLPELLGYIQVALPYYVNLAEETQLLSGDNTGENLHGLITQASSFTTGLLPSSGWNRIDIIGRAIQQISASNEIDPTFVVLNTNDWWSIRLTKDNFGRYILGDPQQPSLGGTNFQPVPINVFGLMMVPTTSISQGTFLVGSGNPAAAEIRDRMEMTVEISTQHMDFFTKNLIAIRAEKRLALIVKRPGSFITGSFSTSPAGQ